MIEATELAGDGGYVCPPLQRMQPYRFAVRRVCCLGQHRHIFPGNPTGKSHSSCSSPPHSA